MAPPTKEELESLEDLRRSLADLEVGEDDISDKNLVRFLRARNGNLDAAESMFRKNQEWQAAENVKALLWEWEYPKSYDEDFFYGMTGFDREEDPLFIAPFGKWDMQKEMALGNKEDFIKYIVHHMERLWTMVKIMSKDCDRMKQAVAIVDLEGLSLRQCTSLDVVEAAIRVLKLFEANHPETLKYVVVVNAPWAFQLIWRIIKNFLSEHTHSKLNFVGSDKSKWKEAMLKLAEPDQFPEKYGGTGKKMKKFYIARDGSWTTSENLNQEEDNKKHYIGTEIIKKC